jgi:hypothetical protein
MNKRLSNVPIALLVLALLALPAAAQVAAPQAAVQSKPVDLKKLVAEIAGDYSFDVQGQTLLIQFADRDGKLYGAPVGEPEEMLSPVADKPYCFDVTVAESGEYFFLEFVRNDKGVIDKCILTSQGMTVEGFKIVK